MPFDGVDLTRVLHQEALERLRWARAQMAAGGWCRLTYGDVMGPGPRCAVGWLGWYEAFTHAPVYRIAARYVWQQLPKSYKRSSGDFKQRNLMPPTQDIERYNDSAYNSRKILKLFDRAIAWAETDLEVGADHG